MSRLKILLLLVLGLTLLVPTAYAQQNCGNEYVVQPGDNLTRIATICGTTVEEIRALNPDVFSLITPGQVLTLVDVVPVVTVFPSTAPAGGAVEAVANGFPVNTPVQVGLGLPGQTAISIVSATTDANGTSRTNVPVPPGLQTGTTVVVTVQTNNASVSATSNALTVTGAPFGTGGPTAKPGLAPIAPPVGVTFGGVLFDRVNVYMIDEGDNGVTGPAAACGDSLIPVQVGVASTVAPLTAGVNALLRNSAASYGLNQLANPLSNTGLNISQILIVNGEAIINLSGPALTNDLCTRARIGAQLRATALQYNTVDRVAIFVNGLELTN